MCKLIISSSNGNQLHLSKIQNKNPKNLSEDAIFLTKFLMAKLQISLKFKKMIINLMMKMFHKYLASISNSF